MNDNVKNLLDRQAKWQSSRAALPWSEKLRESVALRHSINSLSLARRQTMELSSKKNVK